jgi:hypothetical protein
MGGEASQPARGRGLGGLTPSGRAIRHRTTWTRVVSFARDARFHPRGGMAEKGNLCLRRWRVTLLGLPDSE